MENVFAKMVTSNLATFVSLGVELMKFGKMENVSVSLNTLNLMVSASLAHQIHGHQLMIQGVSVKKITTGMKRQANVTR